jgi:hypothetical protein
MNDYSRREGSHRAMSQSAQDQHNKGKIFGFPLEGFGLFQSLLLAFASAFFAFFLATTVAIFTLLIWNAGLGHKINFADSYLYVGFPTGVIVLLIALPYFLIVWIRARLRR